MLDEAKKSPKGEELEVISRVFKRILKIIFLLVVIILN